MKPTDIIVILLLLACLGVLIYMGFFIEKNALACVTNPFNYLEKSVGQNLVCQPTTQYYREIPNNITFENITIDRRFQEFSSPYITSFDKFITPKPE